MRSRALLLVALLGFCFWMVGCGQPEQQAADTAAVPADEAPPKPEPGAMVVVPAGEFTVGIEKDPHPLKLAEPAHKVTLPEFKVDVYEVTNGQFARFQIESDYRAEGDWRSYYKIGREDYPVANVTLNDAKAFCEWAGKRLPTEVEWEKAARGTTLTRYPWGEVFDWAKANVNEHGVRDTMEVGSMPEDKSPYGAYDMFGNVQEWTIDELKPYPGGAPNDVYRRKLTVVRGASYAMKGDSMQLYSRTAAPPNAQWGIGFRCVQD